MMKFQRLLYQFFIFIFSICYFIYCCQANKVSVGGQDGWVLKPSETYDQWSGRNRFQVNDSIVFKYKKGSDSVLVVNEDDYNSCNTKNPIKKMEDGNSEFMFDRSGPFYFISGINDHCAKGQKLLVKVIAVRKNTNPPPIPKAPVPQAQPPISPYPKSPSPSISKAPVPQAQPPTANPPKGLGPISPSPKSQSPSPASLSPISPNSSSPSPSPYAISPPSPPNSPVPAAAPAPGTSASSPPSPGVMSPAPSGGGSSTNSSSPPSPGPAPSGGGSSTNSSSSPQAQNQKSYAMTVTPSSFLVLSVALLVTIVLSGGEFLCGGI